MLLPGGMVLEGMERILDSFDAQPWSTFAIAEPRAVPLGDGAAVLAYRVGAKYRRIAHVRAAAERSAPLDDLARDRGTERRSGTIVDGRPIERAGCRPRGVGVRTAAGGPSADTKVYA